MVLVVRQPQEEKLAVLEGHPFGGEETEKQRVWTECILSFWKHCMSIGEMVEWQGCSVRHNDGEN
jgi:hypothetical protein